MVSVVLEPFLVMFKNMLSGSSNLTWPNFRRAVLQDFEVVCDGQVEWGLLVQYWQLAILG